MADLYKVGSLPSGSTSLSSLVMRLVFSNSYYLDTDISDEEGHMLYTISTPPANRKITTVTRYSQDSYAGTPQVIGVIKWHKTRSLIRFNGREAEADTVLMPCQGSL